MVHFFFLYIEKKLYICNMFDYREYIINEMANRLEEEIYNATRTKEKSSKRYRIYLKTLSPYYGADYNEFSPTEYNTKAEAWKIVKKYAKTKEKDEKGRWHYYRTYTVHTYNETREEREEFVIIDSNPSNDPMYSKSTIREMKRCLKTLREAYICAVNVGRLLRYDCGQESFKEDMRKDLEELKSKPLINHVQEEESDND